jgi:hypothetical protein
MVPKLHALQGKQAIAGTGPKGEAGPAARMASASTACFLHG